MGFTRPNSLNYKQVRLWIPYWNQSMSKFLSFFRWAAGLFVGDISPRRSGRLILAALSAGFLGGVAAECGDTYQAAGQSTGYCLLSPTLMDTLSTDGALKIICGDSFKNRGDISSVAGLMLDQYLMQGFLHSGFWNINQGAPPTFTYFSPMSYQKNGLHQLGSESSVRKTIDICTLELESNLCEAVEAEQ